ncbi:uncharacterized protein TNCV_1466571 [Trichonephila clavipes]|nr:uncharacterized protein TNCV_1466571 [Trichonephila clavipes]
MRCVPSCAKCWMQVSPVPASDEVYPPVCASYEMCSCVSSTNLKKLVNRLISVVNKSVEIAASCDFEKENCDPPVRCTNVSHPSEVGGKEFNVNRSSDCDLKMKVGVEPREIYKDSLETDNGSNIGSEFGFEIDLPGKRDRSTIYRLNLRKLYRRKPELANLVMENSSEGIDFETLYSVKLFMDFGYQGNLRKSQLYFKLPPDRSSYLRMINAKKKERFLPEFGTIVSRRKDINLVTGKPFRIKTCCSSQMLINSLREDTKYLLDLGVNGLRQSKRTLPVVWLGRVNRYPFPRVSNCCMKGILEAGGMIDKCVQMWTRNYDALGQTARVCFGVLYANRTREVKRDFGDLRIRRGEGRVVNTPLVFKRVLFQDRRDRKPEREKKEDKKVRGRAERKDKRVRERERAKPALNGEKELSPEIGVKKTMNAGGVENGTLN